MTKELSVILKQKDKDFIIAISEDIDDSELNELKQKGYSLSFLDLSDDINLLEIGIQKEVKTLFCLSVEHHKNLFVTLSAKNLNPSLNIISVASTENEKTKLLLAGANMAISPYEIASYRIFRHIVKPTVFDILDNILFSNIDIKIAEVSVPQNSFLDDMEFYKNSIEDDFDIIVIGIKSERYGEKFYYNTKKIYHKVSENDIIVVMGRDENIAQFKAKLYS